MNRWILGLVAGVVGLMLIAGCGGGGDSSTAAAGGAADATNASDSTTLTKAEFTKQADAICASAKEEREAALADYSRKVQEASGGTANPSVERKVATAMIDESLLPSIQDQLKQIEDLGVPSADQKEIAKMLNTLAVAVNDLEQRGAEALLTGQRLADFQTEAKAYGFDCPF